MSAVYKKFAHTTTDPLPWSSVSDTHAVIRATSLLSSSVELWQQSSMIEESQAEKLPLKTSRWRKNKVAEIQVVHNQWKSSIPRYWSKKKKRGRMIAGQNIASLTGTTVSKATRIGQESHWTSLLRATGKAIN